MEVANIWHTKSRTRGLDANNSLTAKLISEAPFQKIKNPAKATTPFLCIHQARGNCQGPCPYFHNNFKNFKNPNSLTHDCFGRKLFLDNRDDMSGVGTGGCTLWISSSNLPSTFNEFDFVREFSYWGDLVSVKLIKNYAFIQYTTSGFAQYAKEAMLARGWNVKWAKQDEFNTEVIRYDQVKPIIESFLQRLESFEKISKKDSKVLDDNDKEQEENEGILQDEPHQDASLLTPDTLAMLRNLQGSIKISKEERERLIQFTKTLKTSAKDSLLSLLNQ
ncbi:hypothetical protein DAMA08_002170 [Martiniozyma asiatica (nom. inval.)]|nr:hypothetical protein DAMA08_002170 [Martiniozyma asiatica]